MADLSPAPTQLVAGVRFHKVGKLYHFGYSHLPDLQVSDFVIVEGARGPRMGQVMAFTSSNLGDPAPLPITRKATPRDMVLAQQWQAREPEALVTAREMAARLGHLDALRLVAASYNHDGSALAFLYSTEAKVNLNRLLVALGQAYPACAVELRQIGPRDVAKLMGGMGACGIERCCSTFLTDFSPVSIKMAKAQGVSLNPAEITGMCGRLRCCLVYEYEQYVEARQALPKKGKQVGTPFGQGKVIDVQPMADAVTVLTADGPRVVQRADIVPLDEMRALADKAAHPCDRHGDGPCACGAKPGTATTDTDPDATPGENTHD